VSEISVLNLSGSPFERGLGQSAAQSLRARVATATVGRVETARAEGLIDAETSAYVTRQREFHASVDPDGLAELEGVSTAFGIAFDDVFLHLHLGTLRDLKGGGRLDDGCSAWAAGTTAEGPLVVKNRDYSGLHLGIQSVARHEGPDIATGALLCLGSLGAPGAYSSGINARGLALADTQVSVRTHRVGYLRYFLMTRLLARCADLAEALALIRAHPHAGGGTLVIADARGATAAVELSARGPEIVEGPLSVRTNHYVTPGAADETLSPGNDRIAGDSRARFAFLSKALPGTRWDAEKARRLMATHIEGDGGAPICRHGADDGTMTIASAVYSCRAGALLVCPSNPCSGEWRRHDLDARTSRHERR